MRRLVRLLAVLVALGTALGACGIKSRPRPPVSDSTPGGTETSTAGG